MLSKPSSSNFILSSKSASRATGLPKWTLYRFTPAEDDLIVRLHPEGQSVSRTAATIIRLSIDAVQQRLLGPLRVRAKISPPRQRLFTSQEQALILELRAKGTTFAEIARQLDRTCASVNGAHRRPTRSQEIKQKQRGWTQPQTEELLDLHRSGMKINNIATHLGRSQPSVKQKLDNLGTVTGRKIPKDNKKWRPDELETLHRLRRDGLSFKAIATRFPGISAGCVWIRYHRLKEAERLATGTRQGSSRPVDDESVHEGGGSGPSLTTTAAELGH